MGSCSAIRVSLVLCVPVRRHSSLRYLKHAPSPNAGEIRMALAADIQHVKTKIVATIGPASESTALLTRLAQAGADVFRLNFAHGNWDWHTTILQRIRNEVSKQLKRPLAVLQDLGGPKLRLGEIPGGNLMCYLGDRVRFVKEPTGKPG